MEIEKDGLHTYELYPYTENDYYFSMEYPIIVHNQLHSLLPMEVREENGEKKLLFNVTGMTKMEDYYRKRQLAYGECYDFMKAMLTLFQDLEDFMLTEEQVSFKREDIYIDSEGKIFWKYTPKCNKEVGKEIEDLLLWILGHLDYRDQKAMNFMQRFFSGISRQEFSRDYLQKNLYQEHEGVLSESEPKPEVTVVSETGNKKKGVRVLDILGDVISIICALLIIYGIWLVSIKGFNTTIIIFLSGNLILAIGMQIRRLVRKVTEQNSKFTPDHENKKDEKNNSITYTENTEDPLNIFERLEEHWERGDETVLLSDISNQKRPGLTREESGETVTMRVFPFYIGSEEGLNQLPLSNRAVSRQHAVIVRGEDDDSYYIEDLSSKNGTFVNGRKIEENQEIIIVDGSRISFANDSWIFNLHV